jgi:hypothetical protein
MLQKSALLFLLVLAFVLASSSAIALSVSYSSMNWYTDANGYAASWGGILLDSLIAFFGLTGAWAYWGFSHNRKEAKKCKNASLS